MSFLEENRVKSLTNPSRACKHAPSSGALRANTADNSSSSTSSIVSLTLHQHAVDKKLDRAIRDVEAKASDLAIF